jgi:hypothetical protein
MLIDLQKMDNFYETIFVKNKKYERGGRLKGKIHILFMETTHGPLQLVK